METIQKAFRRIAIDIDGVLADFQNPFLNFYNQRHGTRFTIEDMLSYEFWEVLQIGKEELAKEMIDFYGSPNFRKIPLIGGAKEAIAKLRRRNLLYSVTSRPDFIRDETITLLGEHFPGAFLQVHFTNQYGGNGSKEKKSDFCLKYGYEIIIEDVAGYANECAEKGITAFILTRPWNKGKMLHPEVNRVQNWEEILQYLE